MKAISLSKHTSGGLGDPGRMSCSWNLERAELSDQSATLSLVHMAHWASTVVLIPLTSTVPIFAVRKREKEKTS